MCLLMGEGMNCGGLPFPGTGCPILDADNLCLLYIDFYVWDAVSIFHRLPRMFLFLTTSLGCFCPWILLF